VTEQQFISHVSIEQQSLRRFLLALCCGRHADAEDIAQESLVKAFLASERLPDDARFAPWLLRIAHNVFLDHYRRRRDAVSVDQAANLSAPSMADEAYRYQDLYMSLDRLSEKERSAVLLYYMQGYAVKEIAEITDSSVDAVKKQLSRGREQLKQYLQR
jgi:RNA polymerase sigma factor (sigma-70 family)